MPLLELRTPRDLLEKARREHARFNEEWGIDNVFNFFVSAHSIHDYVLKSGVIPQVDLEAFVSDPDIRACRDISNQGKHLRLSKHDEPEHFELDGTFGGAPFGSVPFGSGTIRMVTTEDGTFELDELPKRFLDKWEHFLSMNGV